MTLWYTLAIHPEKDEFDYYEVNDLALPNAVHKGDFVLFRDTELEVGTVVHEVGGKTMLHVVSDEKL